MVIFFIYYSNFCEDSCYTLDLDFCESPTQDAIGGLGLPKCKLKIVDEWNSITCEQLVMNPCKVSPSWISISILVRAKNIILGNPYSIFVQFLSPWYLSDVLNCLKLKRTPFYHAYKFSCKIMLNKINYDINSIK